MTLERQHRVFAVFDGAIERPEADRESFIAAACAEDPELEAEVRSLLTAHAEASGFLSRRTSMRTGIVVAGGASALPALQTGARLGAFVIEDFVGAGGMGEVYQARDTRLDRHVAIKVLLADAATDPRGRGRFISEARAIARMSHPNICALHDIGQHDGIDYLVMEYLEGESLSNRLRKGAPPLSDALRIALEVGRALDAAHARGIVHRDVKPGNIMLTKSGAKLLDFGLARLRTPKAVEGSTINGMAPSSHTAPGLIVGTVHYMSPEQLEGRDVDSRTDIFAFGALLYEMVTGHKAFHGDSRASVISAIMSAHPPPISSLQPRIPALDRVVEKCLEKNPDDRWSSIHDVLMVLEWMREGGSKLATNAGQAVRARASWALLACGVLAALSIGALLGRLFFTRSSNELSRPLARVNVDLGPRVVMGSREGTAVILSRDGQRLAFLSQGRLWTRRLDQANATELAGTDGAFAPFFSADGRWIAFFTQGKLKKASFDGGSVITVCDAPLGRGGSWREDGSIVAALSGSQGLSRIPPGGGQPEPLTTLAPGEFTHRWPQILPGGAAVLYTSHTAASDFDAASIEVVSLVDGRRQTLQRNGTFGRYFAGSETPGYLTYINRGVLYAAPFDATSLQLRGKPSAVLEQVAYSSSVGSAQVDLSESGTLIYRRAAVSLQQLDPSGKTQPLPVGDLNDAAAPALSPSGSRLALIQMGDVWVHDLTAGTRQRVVADGDAAMPVWTSDDRYIIFHTSKGMSWVRADGGTAPQSLTRSTHIQSPSSVTSDGKTLAFIQWERGSPNAWDIWTVPLESDASGLRAGREQPFRQTTFDERAPAFSGDGRRVAYMSNESGEFQIFVRAFPDTGEQWLISKSGGTAPRWSPKDRELFFVNADGRIMTTTVHLTRTSLTLGTTRVWSETRIVGVPRSYALSPDGRYVIALLPVDVSEDTQNDVTFLFNAFAEMRRTVRPSE